MMRSLLLLLVAMLLVVSVHCNTAETLKQTQTQTQTLTQEQTVDHELEQEVVDASKMGVPITIELVRHTSSKRPAALAALRMRQAALFNNKLPTNNMHNDKVSLLQQQEVPLEEEILSEKHLATYYGTITIDHSDFRVLFDTGSCEFWVPSSECDSPRCQKHNRFPAESPRFRELLHRAGLPQLNIQYLSGKVQGTMISEPVKLGDVVIKKQEVGLAKVVDIELLDDVQWDGILGLAYPNPALSSQGVYPLFDTIIRNRVLTNRKLSNQLAYYIDDSRGSVTLGGANCDLVSKGDKKGCIDKFHFVPVTEKTYWTVTLKDVQIQYPGKPVQTGFCPSGSCKAIVDTGTYLVYGPEDQVSKMLTNELRTCGDYKTMPTFTFVFFTGEGKPPLSLTLNPIDYILKFQVESREDCVVGISPDKDTIWTLGQVFLRSFYTVFDRDQDRIGFARLPRENFQALNANSVQRDVKKGRGTQSMLEVGEAQSLSGLSYDQVIDNF